MKVANGPEADGAATGRGGLRQGQTPDSGTPASGGLCDGLAAWWADRKWPVLGWLTGVAAAGVSLLVARPLPDGGIAVAELGYAILLLALPVLAGLAIDAIGHASLRRRINPGTQAGETAADLLDRLAATGDPARSGLAGDATRMFGWLAGLDRQARDERWRERRQYEDDQAALIHEAKTPLAAMLLALEAREQATDRDGTRAAGQLGVGTGPSSPVDDEAEFLVGLRVELGRLEDILERGLFTARADSFAADYLIAETDLRQLVSSVAARFALPLMGRSISFRLAGEGTVLSDAKWLAFILAQFFTNALKYLPPGSSLAARISRRDRATELCLEDDGPGIPAEELARLFERGFSGQRFRSTRSSGLGLYLARRLCERLGHELSAANRQPAGASFSIRFPDLPELT